MSKKSKSSLPTEWEHFDILELERHTLREENAKIKLLTLQVAEKKAVDEANAFRDKMRVKYKMGPKDAINTQTRQIERGK